MQLITTMPSFPETPWSERRASRVRQSLEESEPKCRKSYNVLQMEFKNQDFNLHQTGSRKKTAEFSTADNFTGFYLIDAKQTIPGQRSLKEHEEYLGSFEISRRLLFRNQPTFKSHNASKAIVRIRPSIVVSPRERQS